ncbi:CBS domain-containing protein [bacterium]|nr:CBS domain-containing protein [bacterium]
MRIRDLMTEKGKLACVTSVAFLPEVAQRMQEADTGVIPVLDAQHPDKLVGIITDRDIAVRAVAKGVDLKNAKVQDFMTQDVNCISPDVDTLDAARLMAEKQLHRLCVVDNEKLVGILSLGDLAETEIDRAEHALKGISHGAKVEQKKQ